MCTIETSRTTQRISNNRHTIQPLEDTIDTRPKTSFTASTPAIIDLYPDIHRLFYL